jgi:hypothetical protein
MKTLLFLAVGLLFFCPPVACCAERPEYLDSFDPAKGFKPAQRDLTEVFLQIAGSLEAYGSPEPYIRHVAKEHSRIEALYRQKFGKPPRSFRPDYMTDAYIDRLSANWNLLSPKIGLEPFAKEFGHTMRDAIKGTRGTGTLIVDIFNRHQDRVFREFTGKSKASSDFESLRLDLVRQLELDKVSVDDGRYELPRRDAIRCAIIIHGRTIKLFATLDRGLKPAAADTVKVVLKSVIMDTGTMAQSELEVGIAEWALKTQSGSELAAYDASSEPGLNDAERKVFASFLSKDRFSKSDFAILDKFYSTAYDKLSERGKDEMSKRTWGGTRR